MYCSTFYTTSKILCSSLLQWKYLSHPVCPKLHEKAVDYMCSSLSMQNPSDYCPSLIRAGKKAAHSASQRFCRPNLQAGAAWLLLCNHVVVNETATSRFFVSFISCTPIYLFLSPYLFAFTDERSTFHSPIWYGTSMRCLAWHSQTCSRAGLSCSSQEEALWGVPHP